MKLLKALVLTLALSGAVYAGNIQNGVATPSPTPTAQTQVAEPTEPTEQTTTETETPTLTAIEILLTVVSMLGL
jgi:hypothetical protein